MKTNERNLLIAVLWAVALSSFIISCAATTQSGSSLSFVSPTPTPTPTPFITPTPTPVGATPVPGSYAFTLKANFPTSVYSVTHTSGSWANACTINLTGGTPGQAINCLVEVEEGDLVANDFTLDWTTPVGACPYVVTYPYWFYQYAAGYGPSRVDYVVSTEGSINISTLTQTASTTGGTAGVYNNEVKCVFDHSWKTPEGPNACAGSYVEIKRTVTATEGTAGTTYSTTAVSSTKQWGGLLGNAAAGPAASSDWTRAGAQKLPSTRLTVAYGGATGSVKVASHVADQITNLYAENYQAGTFMNQFNSDGKISMGTSGIGSNPYHIFECQDGGFEILAKINLMVRGWNLASELAKGSLGVATTTGTEGVYADPNNDRVNWDDINGAVGPGVYPEDSL